LTEGKAWGGWAKGERNNTIIQYLLDDDVARETDSRFLCSPFKPASLGILDDSSQERSDVIENGIDGRLTTVVSLDIYTELNIFFYV
jgi:hypothetical protein